MALSRCLIATLGIAGALTRTTETPISKVITLLEDLQTEVQGEGSAEAAAYDTFACFCKDSTATKSSSITSGQDNIDTLSAAIQEDTANEAAKSSDLESRKFKQDELATELEATVTRCAKESAEFEANVADLTKALSGLDGAIAAMSASKPAESAAMPSDDMMGGMPMKLIKIKDTVKQSLAIADAMSLVHATEAKAIQNFLQLDPSDPEYSFHSQGIVDTLNTLRTEFADTKTETESEWGKAKVSCSQMKEGLSDDMSTNKDAMAVLEEEVNDLKTSIANGRKDLVSAEALLQDDQTYLKDVTTRCEKRAKEWDQRTGLRSGEIQAIAAALEILKGKVTEMGAVNVRALLQRGRKTPVATQPPVASNESKKVTIKPHDLAMLQRSVQTVTVELTQKHKQDAARAVLLNASARLHSHELSAIAQRIAADPFGKVKTLIQGLIERLLSEATSEASKKGFCDTELGKAQKDRDYRYTDTKKIGVEHNSLTVKKDQLTQAISLAAISANQTTTELATATDERATSKAVNLDTISKAKEGLAAVSEAIGILKTFYKQAAKAALVQTDVKESPVEADDPGAGFDGSYTGKQGASTGVIGLLEVIESDFERTVSTTQSTEKTAAKDFVDFDRQAKTSIAEQLKGKELNEQELQTTDNKLEQTKADLETAQSMLDSALKAIEDLAPMCIDNVMTYAERVAKREEEIEALNTALCLLDPEGVEQACGGSAASAMPMKL